MRYRETLDGFLVHISRIGDIRIDAPLRDPTGLNPKRNS